MRNKRSWASIRRNMIFLKLSTFSKHLKVRRYFLQFSASCRRNYHDRLFIQRVPLDLHYYTSTCPLWHCASCDCRSFTAMLSLALLGQYKTNPMALFSLLDYKCKFFWGMFKFFVNWHKLLFSWRFNWQTQSTDN